ncbi:potassium channel family protein [Natrarchaeobius chitinivorans]|uniref:potassium channel family protein n=1 Tax=Natrarchaeobius chitinivorans TaxID=1679083 RepID=UPI00311F72A8
MKLTRRLAVYVGSLFLLIGIYTLAYRWGMATYEGESRTWYQSLEIVVQSMTTTGYGQDAPWETRWMTALVILIQVTGIAYIVVAIPQFVVPWLETLVEPAPPTEIDHLEDHVIVVGYTNLCDTLVGELEASGTPYVILEGDEDRARTLHEEGFRVLYGDSDSESTLEAVDLSDALAVVIDATERDPVRTTLTIEARDPEATVLALVADPGDARYFRYAGVDEVLSPRHGLGKALGDRLRDVISPDLETVELGVELDVREFPVEPGLDLFGEPIAASRRLERTGATVLGAWVRGDFVTTLSEGVTADENTSVLVAGTDAELEAVAKRIGTTGVRYRMASGPVVVLGEGLVGTTARGTLERADVDTVSVGPNSGEGIDVVGNSTDEKTLLEAGIDEAEAVIVALEADDDAILATLAARAVAPDVEIIAGAVSGVSVNALRTAGADYVLALPNVAGRMLTMRIFEYEVMTLEDRLYLVEVDAPELVGEELSTAELRRESGCPVVALERRGELETDVDGTAFRRDDRLLVAGTDRQLDRFRERFGGEGQTE